MRGVGNIPASYLIQVNLGRSYEVIVLPRAYHARRTNPKGGMP